MGKDKNERVPAKHLAALRIQYPDHAVGRLKHIYRTRLRSTAKGKVMAAVTKGELLPAREFLCVDCAHDATEDPDIDHQWDHFSGYSPENMLAVSSVCSWCHVARAQRRGTYGVDRREYSPAVDDSFFVLLKKVFLAAHTWHIEELRTLIKVTKSKFTHAQIEKEFGSLDERLSRFPPKPLESTCTHAQLRDSFLRAGSPEGLNWFLCETCGKPVHHETLRRSAA